jgi:predicted nucleic acid-binding protein
MANRRVTFDTNILIYSIDVRETPKHLLASEIVNRLASVGGSVPLQCLNEFYAAVAKKRLLGPFEATRIVRTLVRAMEVIPPTSEDLAEAMTAHQAHKIPFFDALLWATAKRAGCTTLITEDFQTNRELGGVTFVNPFLHGFEIGTLGL